MNKIPPQIQSLMQLFLDRRHKIYLVGGAVRCILTEKMPIDFDFATDATPENMMDILSKKYEIQDYGKVYGSVKVKKLGAEITTMRKNEVYEKGKLKSFSWTDSLYQDSLRRDFTVNAIYMNLSGEQVDFHQGLKDLEEKKVVCIGQEALRFQEDPSRILRGLVLVSEEGYHFSHSMKTFLRHIDWAPFFSKSNQHIWRRILMGAKAHIGLYHCTGKKIPSDYGRLKTIAGKLFYLSHREGMEAWHLLFEKERMLNAAFQSYLTALYESETMIERNRHFYHMNRWLQERTPQLRSDYQSLFSIVVLKSYEEVEKSLKKEGRILTRADIAWPLETILKHVKEKKELAGRYRTLEEFLFQHPERNGKISLSEIFDVNP